MDLNHRLKSRIEKAISNSFFPGMGLVYGTLDQKHELYIGHQTYEAESPNIDSSTIYDIASITKTFTAAAILRLISEGKFSLDDSLGNLLDVPSLKTVKLIHALSHTSGLKMSFGVLKDDPEKIRQLALETSPEDIPGTHYWYSTLNMYLLGLLIEKTTGERLDIALKRLIFDPLNMKDTLFCPPKELKTRIAPTEIDSWRNRTIQGEVHDEAAYALGGIVGFAGAFSTSHDLFKFCTLYLDENQNLIDQNLLAESVKLTFPEAPEAPGFNFKYGFCGLRVCPRQRVGHLASEETLEHSGFPSPAIIIDLKRGLAAAFTCNATYPHRPENFDSRIALRAELFDMMCEEYPVM